MIHTVHLDDTYSNIKNLLQEIRSQKHGVKFEYAFVSDNIQQEEYMTSEDFWKEADKRIIKICDRYGVL
ncbi:MAG: hypothetical protein LBE82_06545 [Chitinophagaceae bacterium]|nr:hypothetical protein [Chitinophagaceae bacterium]